MRVLCSDPDPCPIRPNCCLGCARDQLSKGSYGSQNTNEKERTPRRPPWTLAVGVPKFSVNKDHVSYIHYSQCITHLPSPQAINPHQIPTILFDLFQMKLSQFHPSFAVIVNLLVDRYFPSDPDDAFLDGPPDISYDSTSMVDYILSSMLAIMPQVRAVDPGTWANQPEGDISEGLVLCCLAHQWRLECRRRRAAVWSPMPWSRASELETEKTALTESTFTVQSICEEDLPAENDPGVRFLQSTVGHPLDIPWFGAPHDDYPFCHTLSTYTMSRRRGKAQTLFDDAALWVSALSLGVLEATTRTRIPEAVLVRPGSTETGGRLVLSGTRILRLLAYWRYHATRSGPASYSQTLPYAQATVRLLERALSALDEEIGIMTSVLAPGGLVQEVKLDIVGSIALTIIPLALVAREIWHALPEVSSSLDQIIKKERSFYPAMVGSCRERMYRAGWCPYTLSDRLLGILGQSTLFLSSIANLPPYIRRDREEHRNCNRSSCAFYTISDTTTYVPRHAHPACTCEFSRPPLDSVIRLLSEGQIPVIIYDGVRELRIEPAQGHPYVAVSHVWADGMGSTTEDGLPTCMVARVARLAQTLLPKSGAFWIDALCIPANGEMRKRAIKLMAQTYRDAAKVLVIDECVRKQCSLSKPWEENLLRIATSGWVRRIWTLQEGLLARELWVEFAEGPVDIEESLLGTSSKGIAIPPGFVSTQSSSLPSSPQLSVSTGKLLPLVPLFGFRARHKDFALNLDSSSQDTPISDIAELLLDRTTTKAEDELPAISSLLPRQVDLDAILSITGPDAAQRRIQAFLLQVRELSRGFALYPMPRLTLPGFSWAPRALATIAGTVHGEISRYGRGICTKEGLLAEYFVAAFDKPVSVTDTHRLGNTTGDEMFGMHVVHRTSTSTSISEPWVSMWIGSSRSIPVTIDALLFLSENALNAGRHVWGAAVCGAWDDGSSIRRATEDGTAESRPRRLTYVAPCMVLNDTSVKRLLSFQDKEGWPGIGLPSSSWVLLQ
ncbi:hypothetical protein C8Q79DRAFT_20008 [Trametes meyenii]|nr:hypothetical protein C8Q79DRAFT_20008 [Trametes meyenii]